MRESKNINKEAENFLKVRLFYDPETKAVYSLELDVLASTMVMFAKKKHDEWTKEKLKKSLDGEKH